LPILLLAAITALGADISLKFTPGSTTGKLATTRLENRDYVNMEDLNSILCAVSRTEYSEYNERRIFFYYNGNQFIFLVNSPFYTFKQGVFNMQYPFLQDGSAFYLPAVFVLENLPLHFPNEISLSKNVLQLPKPVDKSVRRIVIDPGHGGKDPGAVGQKRTREKDINLRVGLLLKGMLERELGVEVLMTRPDDRFASLGSRTKYANDNHADLFVSLHTNAARSSSAKGLETYYLSTSSSSDNRAVEALENGVVELYEGAEEKKRYEALDFILSDMLQTEHLEYSNDMATLIQRNLVSGVQGWDRGVKQANFYVLRGAFMPSILVEMGFISNPNEEALLSNPEYQERLARTIFEGIKRFKYRYDRIRKTA
jgi:N-acetylmuramoyl-L-alanine amidase